MGREVCVNPIGGGRGEIKRGEVCVSPMGGWRGRVKKKKWWE